MTTRSERVNFCRAQIEAQEAKIANIERSIIEMTRATEKALRKIAGYEARIETEAYEAEDENDEEEIWAARPM